jgi:hypothetical protein
LKAKEMVGVLTDVSQLDHSKYNALIVCILSHGNENVVYGIDAATKCISCRELVNFQSDDDEFCFALDQHTDLDFYSASSLKQ